MNTRLNFAVVVLLAPWLPDCGRSSRHENLRQDNSASAVADAEAKAIAKAQASGSGSGSGSSSSSGVIPSVTPPAAVLTAPFVAVAPYSYVAKVKNILTGKAATASEVSSVTAKPENLKTLIQQWMTTPDYQTKMLQFFGNALQQSHFAFTDITDANNYMWYWGFHGYDPRGLFQQSLAEIVPRTALMFAKNGTPFNQLFTTQTWAMNTYAQLITSVIDMDSDGTMNGRDYFLKNPNFAWTLESTTPIPLSDSLDPNNANYLTFYEPSLTQQTGSCATTSVTMSVAKMNLMSRQYHYPDYPGFIPTNLMVYLSGTEYQYSAADETVACYGTPANNALNAADYTNWQLVKTRLPVAGEQASVPWNLAALRAGNDLKIITPRIGPMSSISFFAQYPTNASNVMRDDLNQAMIIGLGTGVTGADSTIPLSLAAVDTAHAHAGTPCYGCHVTLDPMKQYYMQTYSLRQHHQTDPTQLALPGQFAFKGVTFNGGGFTQFASLLSTHSNFAPTWVQNLCNYAISLPCDTSDPEFIRISNDFVASNYNWNSLIVDFFSSPLLTNATATKTVIETGQVVSAARLNHLCGLLSSRLGIADICGLLPTTVVPQQLAVLQTAAGALPMDMYSRGNPKPLIPTNTTLIYSRVIDNVCAAAAGAVVGGSNPLYPTASINNSITAMVNGLMGVLPPGDAETISILTAHYNAALATQASSVLALESTFVAACAAAVTIGVGL